MELFCSRYPFTKRGHVMEQDMRAKILAGYALVDEGCDQLLQEKNKTLEQRQRIYIIQINNLKLWVALNNEK